jgi:hypothetical protein
VTVLGERAELWRHSGGSGNWLAIRLRGRKSNRDGIGARVCVDGRCQWMSSSQGYASSSLAPLHFGLGVRSGAGLIEVTWPSGTVQRLRDVAVGQVLNIAETQGRPQTGP